MPTSRVGHRPPECTGRWSSRRDTLERGAGWWGHGAWSTTRPPAAAAGRWDGASAAAAGRAMRGRAVGGRLPRWSARQSSGIVGVAGPGPTVLGSNGPSREAVATATARGTAATGPAATLCPGARGPTGAVMCAPRVERRVALSALREPASPGEGGSSPLTDPPPPATPTGGGGTQ